METLNALKIYYFDKKEITLRTDCHAIISFYNKMAQNKPFRVLWIAFTDYINGLGISVNFEHIDEKNNVLADMLSRLTFVLCAGKLEEETTNLLISEWSKVEMEAIHEQEKEKMPQEEYAEVLSGPQKPIWVPKIPKPRPFLKNNVHKELLWNTLNHPINMVALD
ncbi:hypothetical protein MA16_Dca013267 [Dendrobium catenatum]|uniref:Reverse transcriptase RNase H-like domain-containing protein n=1 Tax=Dendrobium catenatum TaxID=906689 RepID=A0A2I0WDE5_9ASPA|nr:hypothetical protein MA16_Dca013267 [Dendrobium catenatum]